MGAKNDMRREISQISKMQQVELYMEAILGLLIKSLHNFKTQGTHDDFTFHKATETSSEPSHVNASNRLSAGHESSDTGPTGS